MGLPISSGLRMAFLGQAIVSTVLGLLLWLIPGHTLLFLSWVPVTMEPLVTKAVVSGTTFVDPILTRIIGAALLALAFVSLQSRVCDGWSQVALLVKLEFVFFALGAISTVAYLLLLAPSEVPAFLMGWILTLILTVCAVVWGLAWKNHGTPE